VTAPPADRRFLFVVGAARSGTTWLQNLLGAVPEIVTPQELHLFTEFIPIWQRRWSERLPGEKNEWSRYIGLPSVMTEEDFYALMRGVIEQIYAKVAELKPSAHVVLDKSPANIGQLPLIQHYLPDARVVHVIRDGRDVVTSRIRASKGFASGWASSSVEREARQWRWPLDAARQFAGPHYREIRFEELRSPDGPEALHRVFAFAGVEVDVEACAALLERFSLERNGGRPPSSIAWGGEVIRALGAPPEEPSDFFGPGLRGGWRAQFGAYDRWVFDQVAGELLVGFGYEPDRSWARAGPAATLAFRLRRAAASRASRARSGLSRLKQERHRARPGPWLPPAPVGRDRHAP
jgi:Sulfotransferase family